MADDLLRAELKAEYSRLQDTYEDFDKRSLGIKGWIAAAAITAAALGLNPDKPLKKEIWIVVAAVSLSIWVLETYWKMFQYGFRDRIRVLEAYFRDDPDVKARMAPFQIYNSWWQCYAHDQPIYAYERSFRPANIVIRFFRVMGHPFVALPYAPLIIASVAFYQDLECNGVVFLTLALIVVLGSPHLPNLLRQFRRKAAS